MDNNCENKMGVKELIFRILYSWRKIIVVALIFSILCGGYKYMSGINILNNESKLAGQEAKYQTKLLSYETTKATLEKEIENLTESLERLRNYNDKSILMQINPFDKKVASINYYVDTNYQIMPGLTYQNIDLSKMVIHSYLSVAQNGDMYNYIMENLSYDIERRYLREIFTVSVDYDTNMIFAQVFHSDIELCEEIFVLARNCFEQVKDSINEVVAEHTLSIIKESSQAVVDFELEIFQKDNHQTVADYVDSLAEKTYALDSLREPTKTVTNNSNVISTFQYVIIGFALGVFIAAFIILLSYMMSDKLINIKELRARYNLRLLGITKIKSNKRIFEFVDRCFNKLGSVSELNQDMEETTKRVAANLKAILEIENIKDGNIILTGTSNIANIDDICNKVSKELMNTSYKLVSGANISYSANTIEMMRDCNAVVLVEELNHSTYTEITKQLEYIIDLDKKVIGVVVI